MPRRSKGPRLYLQKARPARDGKPAERAVWVIRDGDIKRSTGAGPSEGRKAEIALTAYLNAKAAPRISNRDPASVLIADVVSIYIEDVAHKHSRPHETAARLDRVLDHLGDKPLSYLNKTTCAEYVTARGTRPAARRELSDLRAAVRHHWQRGLCSALTPVVLPQKGEARERWLTRKEAAKLLMTAWRMRQPWRGEPSDRPTAQHIARFIIAGLYTGTRAGAICGAALKPGTGTGWIDVEHGVFYRRGVGSRRTNKRQPSIRMPPRFLTHTRRWVRLKIIRRHLIEWNGEPVLRINKGFRAVVKAAGLGKDVSPHTLRHTAITWQAQLGVSAHEICGFFGITREVFEQVYGHHSREWQAQAVGALSSTRTRQKPDRYSGTEREQRGARVVKLNGNH
jgi:integrase